MADYLYNSAGNPQGFRLGSYIYALDGTAIGRVWAEKAYKLDGTYVGALVASMVVDKPEVSRRNQRPVPYPGDAKPPSTIGDRKPIAETLADVFHLLEPPARVQEERPVPAGSSWEENDGTIGGDRRLL